VSGRIDGNSSFGTDKRYAAFWSGGVGMNFHNLEFVKNNITWLNMLKLRSTYGTTGKASFSQSIARNIYSLETNQWYATGNGAYLTAMGNTDLKWETTTIKEFGGELSLFKNFIYLKYTRYIKNTEDLISSMVIPTSSGFSQFSDNVGEIENKGHELSLRLSLVNKKDFQFFINGSFVQNKNKLVNISNSMKRYNDYINELSETHFTYYNKIPQLRYYEGASMTSIYALQSLGIDPISGQEVYRYKDGTVGYEWIGTENVVVGNTEPDASGSFGIDANYKGFMLNMNFSYEFGGQRYNNTLKNRTENADIKYNCDKDVLDERWLEVGDIKPYKSLEDYDVPTKHTSRFVQDYNFLKLTNLTLGYKFNREWLKKLKLKTLKLSFNMNDVFQLSSIERERGTSYPFARRFNFSLNTSF
jgi:hypothetical protein